MATIKTSSKSRMYEIKAKNNTADIWIYEDIGEAWFGGVSAKQFADDLKGAGLVDLIRVFINSGGGNIFDGVAIYNSLKRHNARIEVSIDSAALSIASIIAMAGDEIKIANNAQIMIHDPWTVAGGSSKDFRHIADIMDKTKETLVTTYQGKTGLDPDKISSMMAEETWMNAEEAVQHGFADTITGESQLPLAASVDKRILEQFKNMPKEFLEAIESRDSVANEKRAQSEVTHNRLAKMQEYYRSKNW